MSEFYIVNEDARSGPYDLVGLVRKIRTGQVSEDTPIATSAEGDPAPASSHESLQSFFEEEPEVSVEDLEVRKKRYSLLRLLKNGGEMLVTYHGTPLFSGLLLLMTITLFITFSVLRFPGYILAGTLTYVFYAGFQLYILRVSRGQPVDLSEVLASTQRRFFPLAFAGLFVFLPVSIGIGAAVQMQDVLGGLIMLGCIVIGLFVLTLFSFTPLLIIERGFGTLKAMNTSRKAVIQSGSHNFGVLFSLAAINFLGALCALFGLLITLTMTSSGTAEMYDEYFLRM